MLDWVAENQIWLWTASVVMFVGGLLLAPWLVIRMPSDYFLRRTPRAGTWRARHPLVRALLHVLKNALGIGLTLAGIAMLVLPGQGILTILVGVSLLEFPGKRRLELALVRRPAIHKALDWIRAKGKRPPLQLPPAE